MNSLLSFNEDKNSVQEAKRFDAGYLSYKTVSCSPCYLKHRDSGQKYCPRGYREDSFRAVEIRVALICGQDEVLTRMTMDQKSSELLEFEQLNIPALYFEQKNKMRKEEQQQLCVSQKDTQKLDMQVYFGIACIQKGETGGEN